MSKHGFEFMSIIGTGAYGIVYSAIDKSTNEKFAIKRNLCDVDTQGLGNIREADFLTRLQHHPHIVSFKGIMFCNGDDFPHHEIKQDEREDFIHFILELETSSLDKLIKRKYQLPQKIKLICAQLLLAVEWIHSRGIVHRDIKPANILVSNSGGKTTVKLCDFGLAGSICGNSLSTPGLVTSWYRAPEICFNNSYNEKIDMWSIGCCIYEIISRHALLSGVKDDNMRLLLAMFDRLPNLASLETIKKLSKGSYNVFLENLKSNGIIDENYDFIKRNDITKIIRESMVLPVSFIQSFNESNNTNLNEVCDLISKLLKFDPDERLSATEALNHPFFTNNEEISKYIYSTRLKYSPTSPELHSIVIIDCPERKFAYDLIVRIYNHRSSIPWYSHRIIFHALDLFDKYLEHMNIKYGSSKFDSPIKIHKTSRDVFLRVYVCMYMFHKLFTTLETIERWETFVPTGYANSKTIKEADDFELYLFQDVCNYELYRETLLEVLAFEDGRIRESRVREFLIKLGEINGSWNGGSIRALYRFLK